MCPRWRRIQGKTSLLPLTSPWSCFFMSKALEVYSEISTSNLWGLQLLPDLPILPQPLLKKLAWVWSCIYMTDMNCKEPFWSLFPYFMAPKWVGWKLSNPLFCIYPQYQLLTLLQEHVTTTPPKMSQNSPHENKQIYKFLVSLCYSAKKISHHSLHSRQK